MTEREREGYRFGKTQKERAGIKRTRGWDGMTGRGREGERELLSSSGLCEERGVLARGLRLRPSVPRPVCASWAPPRLLLQIRGFPASPSPALSSLPQAYKHHQPPGPAPLSPL